MRSAIYSPTGLKNCPNGLKNWADFWDVQKNPGTRCLQRYAARVIAMALMADGVALDALFPYDLYCAFKALDRIKPHIRVWWTQGPQSQQLLRDGEVDAIGIWSTQTERLVEDKAPIGMTLDQAVIDVAYWAVAKGTPRSANAWKFIEFAVRPEGLAKFSLKNGYGPMNPLVQVHLAAGKGQDLADLSREFQEFDRAGSGEAVAADR